MGLIKLFFQGFFLIFIFLIIGYFPMLTTAVTAVSIVTLFLVFGKE